MLQLPLSAVAQGNSEGRIIQNEIEKNMPPSQSEKADPIILEEVEEKRTETEKHFKLQDGTFMVAQMMAGTSNFSYIMVSSGDDLRDQMYIMYGIMLYNEDN